MKLNNFFKLVISLIIPLLVGVFGWLFISPTTLSWYSSLVKPALVPSEMFFILIWVFLYILIGLAFFLVWQQGFNSKKSKSALIIFIFQLVVNLLWLVIFFGTHNLSLALVEIISLWSVVLATLLIFYEILPRSLYFFLPYILWISFLVYFSYMLWSMQSRVIVNPVATSPKITLSATGTRLNLTNLAP